MTWQLPEDQDVELWRLTQFVRLGFDGHACAALLAWDVDTHDAAYLVERGCPLDLVLRILRPDTPAGDVVEPGIVERIQAYA